MRLLIVSLLFTLQAQAAITVAVIDTGFDFKSNWSEHNITVPKLCSFGHYDFTRNSTEISDNHGHGTHIAGLIGKYNEKTDYCLIILKNYDIDNKNLDTLKTTFKAFQKAIDLNVDVINYSGGGNDYSREECVLIKKALDNGIKVITAAGNEGKDLNKQPYYPAMCDNRITKAINMADIEMTSRTPSSNYDGSNNIPNIVKYPGTNILSLLPNNQVGYLTGTSQSAALATRYYIKSLKKISSEERLSKSRYFDKWSKNVTKGN